MSWSRRHKLLLALGVCLWAAGVILTPGELLAAKRREPLRARTVIALVAYLCGALGVLAGLPRGRPPGLPER